MPAELINYLPHRLHEMRDAVQQACRHAGTHASAGQQVRRSFRAVQLRAWQNIVATVSLIQKHIVATGKMTLLITCSIYQLINQF
jgi:hypothetical protein